MNYFALITRGLEEVAVNDMQHKIPDIHLASWAYRRILFSYEGSPVDLLAIRSVDDVFYSLQSFIVGRRRDGLDTVVQMVSGSDFTPILDSLKTVRTLGTPLSFSVSVSNVGEKNYTPKEIKTALTKSLQATRQREEREDGTQDLHIRVFIEKENVLVGVRIGESPLHRRDYKTTTLPGSLRPSVAYCMLSIANVQQGNLVLDPLCGVGTIPLEATFLTDNVVAGDINPEAIRIAEESRKEMDVRASFVVRDARKIPITDGSIDAIVTNLPFGKQIPIENMEKFLDGLLGECHRLLKSDGTMVLLTMHTEILDTCMKKCGLTITDTTEISLFGLTPEILKIKKA